MKYQCNSCAVVYEYRQDAVNCHPDINEIPDEQLESRLAAQHSQGAMKMELELIKQSDEMKFQEWFDKHDGDLLCMECEDIARQAFMAGMKSRPTPRALDGRVRRGKKAKVNNPPATNAQAVGRLLDE